MSWDIFVQDLPHDTRTIHDIFNDFEPQPIGNRDEIICKILEVVPHADFSDPSWGTIELSDSCIEVNIGDNEIVEGFAFHVRGGNSAIEIVALILQHLNLRAIDPSSESGFFNTEESLATFQQWRNYRNRVLSDTDDEIVNANLST